MVETEEDAKVLQDCLDKLIKWGEEWFKQKRMPRFYKIV
jgi:hypothetical protein